VSVGLNLSAEVYDDKENAFWLNGKVHSHTHYLAQKHIIKSLDSFIAL
jgi:hypothetical protein